jgi:small subunit ribosomal protein S1
VLNVDQDRKRIALGLKQMQQDPWESDIPARYSPGDVVTGKVTKLTNFGVFVELEAGLEGLLHISELADHKVGSPEEVVSVGDAIEVTVLRIDPGERKIGLSRKKPQDIHDEEEDGETPSSSSSTASSPASKPEPTGLKGGLGGAGLLFSLGGEAPAATEEVEEEAEAEAEEEAKDEAEAEAEAE